MKKLLLIIISMCLLAAIFCSCSQSYVKNDSTELLSGKYNIEITIKDYGVICAQLDADSAPITVTNFINLAKDNFYDGLTFHRIVENFMMQGGESKTKKADNIKGEFLSNGVDNPLKHTRGALSMARTSKYDSANSQFFIVQEKHADHLDGDYAVFGYVTSGMEIVDKICNDTPVTDSNGTVLPINQPIIESIKVLD